MNRFDAGGRKYSHNQINIGELINLQFNCQTINLQNQKLGCYTYKLQLYTLDNGVDF